MSKETTVNPIKLLKSFVTKVKKDYPDVKIFLFGSRARDDYLKDSDYDLFIISDVFEKDKFVYRMIKMQDYWSLPQMLEALCYTKKEFEKMKSGINIVSHSLKYAKVIC